jgi:Rieske Fe-S protein
MKSKETSRRNFLLEAGTTIGAITFLGTLGSTLESCATGLRTPNPAPFIDVDVSGLHSDNQALIATDPGPDGAGVLIHRVSSTLYRAYSMKCRHRGCNINPPDQTGTLTCPCHGSQYDLNGTVKHGPSESDLRSFKTTYAPAKATVRVRFRES